MLFDTFMYSIWLDTCLLLLTVTSRRIWCCIIMLLFAISHIVWHSSVGLETVIGKCKLFIIFYVCSSLDAVCAFKLGSTVTVHVVDRNCKIQKNIHLNKNYVLTSACTKYCDVR